MLDVEVEYFLKYILNSKSLSRLGGNVTAIDATFESYY